jgi:hypothetical protein
MTEVIDKIEKPKQIDKKSVHQKMVGKQVMVLSGDPYPYIGIIIDANEFGFKVEHQGKVREVDIFDVRSV